MRRIYAWLLRRVPPRFDESWLWYWLAEHSAVEVGAASLTFYEEEDPHAPLLQPGMEGYVVVLRRRRWWHLWRRGRADVWPVKVADR